MKEKKSNVNKYEKVVDESNASIIRLIGLFLIVYALLCFTSGEVGCILSVPFTFLFGSFAPIILVFLMVYGAYMLVFKKSLSSLTTIQYVLLSIMFVFALVLATSTDANQTMTLSDCFSKYVGKNGIYRYNFRFIISNESESISQLGGGMFGYMFYGMINSITGGNHIITIVISSIMLAGVGFIFFAPLVAKFFKWCKKVNAKNLEKKAAKKQKAEEKAKKDEMLKQERLNNSSPVTFNIKKSDDEKLDSKDIEDLLETTEINITGDNFNYEKRSNKRSNKLSGILSVFDEEIYPNRMKQPRNDIFELPEVTSEVKLDKVFQEDFNNTHPADIDITSVIIPDTIISSTPVSENEQVIVSVNDVDVNYNKNQQVTIQEMSSKDHMSLIGEDEVKKEVKIEETIIPEVIIKEENIEKIDNEIIFTDNNNLIKQKEEVKPSNVDLSSIPYELPPLYLLKEATDNGANAINEEVAKEKAAILMEKMRELNVNATINAFVVGPAVTRFEIALAPGVRVGSFTNLQEDFKLALGVNSIRIESPIPGKSAIGIEVPNKERAMVSMKEIITKMPNKKEKLYVPVGKDITGTPLSFPVVSMPHCLISGATNSGKSVCANTIILSLLMNYKPSEVRMIMVDPKRVEMLFYKDIPHLLCPIITESEKARVALDKLCDEMNKRFTIYSEVGVKNIASYNEIMISKNKPIMPFIFLIVDEFAELMLCKSRNIVEEKIQKLAQLGRAAGIHLILSTQRPDVNVIPGTIKTNLPCRMTFRLSSLADSRTVIDLGGAEKLLNNGDMLLLTPDFTGLRRVQGVYVSDKEIADVVEFCKKQVGPQYDPNFLDLRTQEEKDEDEKLKYAMYGNNNKDDETTNDSLYNDIKRLVIADQKASTSYLQRKFGIGYQKAARYIDMLEEDGIVGPENGSKPREVLITSEEDL